MMSEGSFRTVFWVADVTFKDCHNFYKMFGVKSFNHFCTWKLFLLPKGGIAQMSNVHVNRTTQSSHLDFLMQGWLTFVYLMGWFTPQLKYAK